MKARSMKLIAVVLSVGMLTGLAACEGQVPVVQPSASSSATPDMSTAQEKKIRLATLKVIDDADAAKNVDLLPQRLSGPELDVRTSQLTVAKATGGLDKFATIPKDMTQTVIPTDSGWPREVYTITTTTQDQQSKRLLVLRQDSARSNYQLWGMARLFQGAKLPKFAVPDIGAQLGQADDPGLLAKPQDAVNRYADLLQNGSGSRYAGDFADDYFRQSLTQLTQTVQEGMQRNNGTQQQIFNAAPDQISVMRSSDGGDLVVARIDSEWTRQTGQGRESLPANDDEKALFGAAKPTSTLKVTYVNVVALYVPPAKANQKITAVGAERQPIKVEAL
ncbi:MAG: hypothetical protein LKF49_05065 [Bifidobacterium tibiigranuli]|jgi:hypothetical protein|uniref:hypothetical protein n=1 Tax=Bifidobacterium tibiigranuli TaxID=2172043 RepID=UPI002353C064|nr:hypothetical protein [Bifidobacterium tibiigranuli]MCH3975366.1 hypothetical protein [Bifidobacterium tibiigranuli]MCH4189945.1 hypothetical protein [Bifidobacterium tibiigranuli]MCH4203565.1 hypothetical protein [Bifidobacterium tibiigranuli]MCH4273823.1 hypothetical protein [Bifidobacterium tibiigranuli]MCI1791063.1 hypothetical protein [Bifidobacterium tibiigranuli]